MSCSIAHAEPNIRRDRWSDMRRANISQHSRDNDPLAEELNRSPGLAREYPAVQWTLSSRLKKPRNQLNFFFGIMVLRIMKSGRIRQDLAAEFRGLRMFGIRYVMRAEWAYGYDSRLIFVFLWMIANY